MNSNRVFYEISEGLWSVATAAWIERDNLPVDARLVPLRDLSDLKQTLRFYNYPLGELAEAPDRIKEIATELDHIDAEYLKPHTLAGLAIGDPGALARKEECDQIKAPLKRELTELQQLLNGRDAG